MSCRRPSYRYWIEKNDYWWRSDINDVAGGYAYGKEWESKAGAASRRRVDQPVRFPDADDALLVAMLEFVDVSVVSLAAQINRRWRRAAGTRALWQRFVQLRWPDVWAGLAAPTSLEARALYRRLACPQPRRETTPEGVLLQFELVVGKKMVISATAPLDEIQRQSAAASYYENTLRLRPAPSAAYDALVAQVDAEAPIRNRALQLMMGKRVGEISWTEALEQAGGVPSRMIQGTTRASISLIRRADGAVVRTELDFMDTNSHGIEFTGTLYPIQPERSWVRRRAMARQDKHEETLRAAGVTPKDVERKRRGGDVRELGLELYLTFDGRPVDFPAHFSETDPEAWQPGDIALIFREDTWDQFHRTDADGCELKAGDEDRACVGISAGYSSSMKLDTCALGSLEWNE